MIKTQWLWIVLCMTMPAAAEFHSAYFFGCSTTDQFAALPEILAGSDDSVEFHKHTVPGCGMECLWEMGGGVPADFQGKSWYCMCVAPFKNGLDLGVNNDVKYISYWYDVALQSNPDCILYVFSMYTGREAGSWDAPWNSALDTTAEGYAQEYASEAYQFMMVNALRAKYPGKTVLMMGVAHVMNAFEQAPFPGFSGAFDLYADAIHLNKYGQYLQNLTAYATIWRKHPASAGTYFNGGWGDNGQIEADFAARAKDLVWNTVSLPALTGYTGVSGTTPVVAPPASAITPVRQAGTPSGKFTIDGRNFIPALLPGQSLHTSSGVFLVTGEKGRGAFAFGQ